jgi:DNA-binding IscR family transcriptional regulator
VLAESLQTNPVFLRRVLSNLKKQDIIDMRRGAHGGILLSRDPGALPLDEVYRTLRDERPLFPMHVPATSGSIPLAIAGLFTATEHSIEAHLAGLTLEDLLRSVGGPESGTPPGTAAP